MATTIERMIEDQAKVRNGEAMIAYAILELAAAAKDIASRLDKLGFNEYSQSGPPGTTEKIAMELGRIADKMSN